jgi:uncharacterized protein
MLEYFIELLRPKVIELFSDDSTGHDISHLERTMKIALFLQKHEGGDALVIGVAAFLHDIHRIMKKDNSSYCLPKDSLKKTEEILASIKFPKDKINLVLDAIEYHEEYYWNKTKNHNLETLIIQDADNLESVGALGIVRTIQYCANHNIELYNPSIPIDESEDYIETKHDPSIVHHFYHKILKMERTMNTETAKGIAKKRAITAKIFVDNLMKELEIADLF